MPPNHEKWPFTLGLTGGIAMGKSTVSQYFSDIEGVVVIDSDKIVHQLYGNSIAADGDTVLIKNLVEEFGTIILDEKNTNSIDRKKLSAVLAQKHDGFKLLEEIVHPAVKLRKRDLIEESMKKNVQLIVLDVPLLFESNSQEMCDAIAVVHCPPDVQMERALSRPGMTKEKLEMILSHQMDNEKRLPLANYIIDTTSSHEETKKHVESLVKGLVGRQGVAISSIFS